MLPALAAVAAACGEVPRPEPPSQSTSAAVTRVDSAPGRAVVQVLAPGRSTGVARWGTGTVLTTNGLVATASALLFTSGDASEPSRRITLRAGDTLITASWLSADNTHPHLAFLQLDGDVVVQPLELLPQPPAPGTLGRVNGYRDGPGVEAADPPTSMRAEVLPLATSPDGGTPSALFVVRLDALEGMRGAPFVDERGRVRGILIERLMGTTGEWVVATLTPEALPTVSRARVADERLAREP